MKQQKSFGIVLIVCVLLLSLAGCASSFAGNRVKNADLHTCYGILRSAQNDKNLLTSKAYKTVRFEGKTVRRISGLGVGYMVSSIQKSKGDFCMSILEVTDLRLEKELNANHLKISAIIAMTIDHATDLFYPSFPAQPLPIALHIIGRLPAPIMWFFIAEEASL